MTKDDCIICNGSGEVCNYPYRSYTKCDHILERSSFMSNYLSAQEELQDAEEEFAKMSKALKSEIKDK